MRFTAIRYSSAKRLASTLTTSSLAKTKTGLSLPKASVVSPLVGYQAALRTYDFSQKRPASSSGGPVTVSFSIALVE